MRRGREEEKGWEFDMAFESDEMTRLQQSWSIIELIESQCLSTSWYLVVGLMVMPMVYTLSIRKVDLIICHSCATMAE